MLVNGTRQSVIDASILKDGKPLTAKDVEAIVQEDKIIFNIRKPAHALTGNYQIKLKNNQGEDIKDVHINMQGSIFKFYEIHIDNHYNYNFLSF